MKALTLSLLLTVVLKEALGLNFRLKDGRQFCMRFEGGGTYTFTYVVSGNEDEKVKCAISQNEKLKLLKEDLSQLEYTDTYEGTQPVIICFESEDDEPKQISFDFFRVDDPVKNMIEKKDVDLVEDALKESYQQMESISRNQEFQIERDEAHKLNLQDSQVKIKWAGIIKIAFLLGSALIQLWIMKGFFTSSNPYQPVETI